MTTPEGHVPPNAFDNELQAATQYIGQFVEKDASTPESCAKQLSRATLLADIALLMAQSEKEESTEHIDNPLLTEPITLEKPPYANNLQSPTPLDPDHVYIDGMGYRTHAYVWMGQRLNKVQETLAQSNVRIDDVYSEAIIDEINAQHSIRCEQNQAAYARLLRVVKKSPERFTPSHAEVIESIRDGSASTIDRLRLLVDYPEMGGVEDMKDTAVFDERGYVKRRSAYMRSLMALNALEDIEVKMISGENDELKLDVVDPRGVLLVKGAIAEITSHGVTIEVVERRGYSALPTRPQLRGISEHLVRLPGSEEQRNLQLIVGSIYFRTHQSLLADDDPEDMSKMLFVGNTLIPPPKRS